jgi:ProP effector
VIAQLAALFPKAFAVNHHERKPLKIGIDADIVARGVAIEPRALWRPLRVYCASFGYLRTIAAGAERVDLDGNPAGVVTAEAAALALALLAARGDKEKRRQAGWEGRIAPRPSDADQRARRHHREAFAPVILFLSIRGRARALCGFTAGDR